MLKVLVCSIVKAVEDKLLALFVYKAATLKNH